MGSFEMDESGIPGARVGETVAEALRRMQPETQDGREARWLARLANLLARPIDLERIIGSDGDSTPVWVRQGEPQTVEQALTALAVPAVPGTPSAATAPLVARLPDAPVVTRLEAHEERVLSQTPARDMTRMWQAAAAGLACVMVAIVLATVVLAQALVPRVSGGRATPTEEMPTDAQYQAELAREVEARCVTWQAELREAEKLLATANLEPVRLSLRADDVFAGSRTRPRLLVEGKVRQPDAPSPLREGPRDGLTVRRFHDRPAAGENAGVLRTIEASF